jgi:hypothetical protein
MRIDNNPEKVKRVSLFFGAASWVGAGANVSVGVCLVGLFF